jgi:hypothetical protein
MNTVHILTPYFFKMSFTAIVSNQASWLKWEHIRQAGSNPDYPACEFMVFVSLPRQILG